MKKIIFVAFIILGSTIVRAETLNLDLKQFKNEADRIYAQEACYTKLEIDAKKNVAEQVLKQLYAKPQSLKLIEKNKGQLQGGDLDGYYMTRTFIVAVNGGYDFPIHYAVTINQYSLKADLSDLKGIEISTQLLNYKSSAELAEGSICNELTYVPTK